MFAYFLFHNSICGHFRLVNKWEESPWKKCDLSHIAQELKTLMCPLLLTNWGGSWWLCTVGGPPPPRSLTPNTNIIIYTSTHPYSLIYSLLIWLENGKDMYHVLMYILVANGWKQKNRFPLKRNWHYFSWWIRWNSAS